MTIEQMLNSLQIMAKQTSTEAGKKTSPKAKKI